MSDEMVIEAALLIKRLMENLQADYDGDAGMVFFLPKDEEADAEIMGELRRRSRDEEGFLEAIFMLINGSGVIAQRVKKASGGDLTSDMIAADLRREERKADDAT